MAAAAAALALACPPAGAGDSDAGDEPPPDGEDAGTPPDGVDAGPQFTGPSVTFKIMDWNVHDFFDETPGPSSQEETFSSTQVNAKISALAKVIQPAAPDILTVQEVENTALLDRLNTALGAQALPNIALVPAQDPRGINVALMSKFPIDLVVSHQHETFFVPQDATGCTYGASYGYSRDALEVHLSLGGGRKAIVIVCHQISQLESSNDCKRISQAQHTREIAEARLKEDSARPVFITGDMNDDPTTPSTSRYFSGGVFTDIGLQATASARWTYCTGSNSSTCSGGTKQRFDYIIPSATAAGWVSNVWYIHGTDVGAASDHEPTTATFTFP